MKKNTTKPDPIAILFRVVPKMNRFVFYEKKMIKKQFFCTKTEGIVVLYIQKQNKPQMYYK